MASQVVGVLAVHIHVLLFYFSDIICIDIHLEI